MPYKEGQPTLIGFLGMAPVKRVTRTRLFGGPYIPFGSFLLVSSFLYENGAILGRAKSDKLTILAKLFPSDPGKEESFINELQNMAQERLNEYKREFEKEPSSFFDIFYVLELKKIGLSLADTNLKTLKKASEEKCSLKQFEAHIKMSGLEGIGFGSLFPELTEKMNRNFYKSINKDWDAWAPRRERPSDFQPLASSKDVYGFPGEPTILSLEAQEELLLQLVGGYTAECYPELLDDLDLRRYQDEAFDAYRRYSGWWQVYHSPY